MKIFQVDAFTDTPFRGNPAAVSILDAPGDDTWMQQVAAEMNLSETAFLHKQGEGYQLRWFTPTVEVDLCGHATLASAHILWERDYERRDAIIQFDTRSGMLTASADGSWIELNFPLEPATESAPPDHLLEALSVQARYVGRNRFDYLVEVDAGETVREMSPDFTLLQKVSCRGVIVTSRSDSEEYDFISRFFAPAAGVNEDPVTGSAHCCLGPYWQERLGKDELHAYQASKRGGFLRVRIADKRTHIAGQAVTVMIGELLA
jgi:predicted PhzF superfamily epimerase YddE/YHI9